MKTNTNSSYIPVPSIKIQPT